MYLWQGSRPWDCTLTSNLGCQKDKSQPAAALCSSSFLRSTEQTNKRKRSPTFKKGSKKRIEWVTPKEGETGEDVSGSAGREQDETNRDVMDESFTDSPGSSFLLTRQKPGLVLTQQTHAAADLWLLHSWLDILYNQNTTWQVITRL